MPRMAFIEASEIRIGNETKSEEGTFVYEPDYHTIRIQRAKKPPIVISFGDVQESTNVLMGLTETLLRTLPILAIQKNPDLMRVIRQISNDDWMKKEIE